MTLRSLTNQRFPTDCRAKPTGRQSCATRRTKISSHHERRIAQRREVYPPSAVRVALELVAGDLQCEPGLAAPARTCERDEALVCQQPSDLGSSPSRPTKLDTCTGRLVGDVSSGRSEGTAESLPESASHNQDAPPMPGSFSLARPISDPLTVILSMLRCCPGHPGLRRRAGS